MDRQLECVFITGASHTGKTTFAKQIANSKGYSSYISSGGKHPLDNYEGQECIILDDLRDNTYELSDLHNYPTDVFPHWKYSYYNLYYLLFA